MLGKAGIAVGATGLSCPGKTGPGSTRGWKKLYIQETGHSRQLDYIGGKEKSPGPTQTEEIGLGDGWATGCKVAEGGMGPSHCR